MPNILLFVHRVNITTFSIIGIFSCCILMVLIKTKTTMEMKSYRRILIQGCVVDLFFGICTLISAPVKKVVKIKSDLFLDYPSRQQHCLSSPQQFH